MAFNVFHGFAVAMTLCVAGLVLFPGVTTIVSLILLFVLPPSINKDPEEVSPDPAAMLYFVVFIGFTVGCVRMLVRYLL